MMEKLLTNTYVQSLWTLFVQNSIVLGVDILGSLPSEKVLRDTILAFWQANIDANVPEKDLPAATLDSLEFKKDNIEGEPDALRITDYGILA